MKNKYVLAMCLAFCCFLAAANDAAAQQASVSFNKKGISVIFKIETSSPEATKQSFGSVYFTGYNETEKESRVHRVLADKASGVYFGYDLVIESQAEPNKFKVSIKPLSINPPEQMRLSDLTIRSLPKYPEDMIVEDGDTIALDVLVNPQTKVKIVDLIKITTKKPQTSSDDSLFTSRASGSGFGSGGGDNLFNRQKAKDFTLNDVKLRLTSPKLLVNGAPSPIRGSQWEGIIEGSVIYLYIPEKGRFIFSLFPQDGFNFRKEAMLENSKIAFQANDERYELISSAPIVSNGGSWSLWILNDPDYKPDLALGSTADLLQYGASDEVKYLLTQKRRRVSNSTAQANTKSIYQKWLDGDVRYIATEAERAAFSQLNTDEEREQFIESFWLTRDPKPETKENEFRREYYNRISYANQNFASGETAGWLTDRGRIFITHGKPDAVQTISSGEMWTYKSLAGVGDNIKFEFVDSAAKGELRLRQ
ncbi:MAG TPA: GWxTD domain-containing protein [Pyrinomonadaceae bacterium]|nr:GWxTD domain-containing protein [Pyrinomonadaceae bacterium]